MRSTALVSMCLSRSARHLDKCKEKRYRRGLVKRQSILSRYFAEEPMSLSARTDISSRSAWLFEKRH